MRNTTYLCRLAVLGLVALALTTVTVSGPLYADGGVVYNDISLNPASGLAWSRTPSPHRLAVRDAAVAKSPYPRPTIFAIRSEETPQKAWGAPGVVVFDYDNDGDLDLYVTNGPDTSNSLFSSQLVETGNLTFVDVGVASGADAYSQESSGACAGDIDNDGDQDLYVLGTGVPNILYENQGDGTFVDITAAAGVAGSGRHAVGCSFGDIDNDGLLDVVVANTYDNWDHRIATFHVGSTYEGMEHNYLFKNQGGNVFADVSASAGIENVSNMSGPGLTGAAFTWAIAMVDLDEDGDIDILSIDNQGGPPTQFSEERGWNRFFENDGSGHFTDATASHGLIRWGGWMGSSYGDFNCDGYMDFFATNLGGYVTGPVANSQWFLGGPGGVFTRPGVGSLVVTPFGWGTVAIDYDNDADADIVYHGSVDIFTLIAADNPGIMLTNDGSCSANFSWDQGVFLRDHQVRDVNGVASGDLNGDGFQDLVSVSNFDFVPNIYDLFAGILVPFSGSPFDAVSRFEPGTKQLTPGFDHYLYPTFLPGSLSVEINSADNGNHWVETTLVGGVGVIGGAINNRDGIGAIVSFTPEGGKTSMQPILGGSSYASQNSLTAGFGMGAADEGTLDVLWPGGVRNRLYDVGHGEKIAFPEIPCSYDGNWGNKGQYVECVTHALNDAKAAGLISENGKARFLLSAKQAFDDEQ